MKLKKGNIPPNFEVKDINGNPISLKKFIGKKVHLVFYRFSGCPFCNLRFHEIDKLAELYRKNNVTLISVYESSAENMRDMMSGYSFYSIMIPNQDSSLYSLYDLDRSKIGLLKFLLFKGGIFKALNGMKLFKKKVAQDGHIDRLEAEFLLSEEGNVVNAHYAQTPGDYLSLDTVTTFVGQNPLPSPELSSR
jgi:peroxiredoxin Q/BCP